MAQSWLLWGAWQHVQSRLAPAAGQWSSMMLKAATRSIQHAHPTTPTSAPGEPCLFKVIESTDKSQKERERARESKARSLFHLPYLAM